MVITLLATVILSSCASTSAGLASSNGAANTSGTLTSPAPSAVGVHEVTLSWNPSISSGVQGYNVYRGSGSGGPYTKLNPSIIAATNYTDNAVQSGQTYYYVVTTTSSSDEESAYSNEVAAPIP